MVVGFGGWLVGSSATGRASHIDRTYLTDLEGDVAPPHLIVSSNPGSTRFHPRESPPMHQAQSGLRSPLHRPTGGLLCALTLVVACQTENPTPIEAEFQLLASADTTADATRPFQLERIRNGVVVLRTTAGPLPQLLDHQGNPIGSLGMVGSGPGELHSPTRIYRWHDSIYVVDRELARLTLFTDAGKYIRATALGAGWLALSSQGLMFSADRFVTSGAISTDLSYGYPLHLLDSTGSARHSWGSEDRSFDTTAPIGMTQVLTRASDTSFWAARPDSTIVRLWGLDGRLLQEHRLDRDWFVEGARVAGAVERHKPPARIVSLATDHCGSLIVVYARPREDWAPYPANETAAGEGRFLPYGEYSRYIYQQVEVIDPLDGGTLALTTRRDTLISGFMSDGTPYGFHSDPDGRQIAVWWELNTHVSC